MSGGSDLDQFLGQPFIGPVFGMMCFFGILLVVMIVLIIYLRQRRGRKAQPASGPGFVTEHDMPDLDLLVNTTAPPSAQSAPVVTQTAPPPPRAARKGTFTVNVQDGQAAEAVEVMIVLRDVVDGHLIVQMGDKIYQNVNSSPEFKERFNRIMRELGQTKAETPPVTAEPSLHSPLTTETQPLSEAEPPESPVVSTPEPLPAPRPAPAPKAAAPSAPPPPLPSGKMPGDLPSFKLSDNPMPKAKRGRKLDLQPVPELNIAGAIEAYLQYKLQHTPEYAGHTIHIYPAPDGGVSIEVDGQYYEAVGDVADTNMREFIAQAIQEWQERH